MLAALLFTIALPQEVPSETVFLRYCLYGPKPACSWISPRAGVRAYEIESRAPLMKAILYAPGCRLDAFTISQENPEHKFLCRALPTVPLFGEAITKLPNFPEAVTLSATYSATWAKQFFGVPDSLTSFPIAQDLPGSTGIQLDIPDFASDPRTASGSIYLWWHEKKTGKRAALLVPVGDKNIDSLKVQSSYPTSMMFTPLPLNARSFHDKEGFAIRP